MIPALSVGDPVTVFYGVPRGAPVRVCVRVGLGHVTATDLCKRGWEMFSFCPDDGGDSQLRRIDREGVTWIRGHHTESSLDVHAALAAWHLLHEEFFKPLQQKENT